MGYAFLFRNYRADVGKWLSQDLIGYPDGWNNFAYCNNYTIENIDLYGAATMNLQGRPVKNTLGAFTHTSVRMAVNPQEYSQLTPVQQGKFLSNGNGDYTSTVSGFEEHNSSIPFDTYLGVRYNDPSDAPDNTSNISDITSPSDGTLDLIKKYLNEIEKYSKNETKTDYDWFPNDPDEANCNSLQGTILDRIGANSIDTNAAGFNHRMGEQFFE